LKNSELVSLSLSSPFTTLYRPEHLVVPGLSYNAMVAWSACTKTFGQIIADQAHLVATLGDRVDDLLIAAEDRMSLIMVMGDDRKRACTGIDGVSRELFNLVWESSLKRRDEHFKVAGEIVNKSGLLELISQLRKAPKLVFIALVNKLFYMKWFTESFRVLANGNSEGIPCDFLESLAIPKCETPDFDFAIERENGIGFNQEEVCEKLEIPQFDKLFDSTDGLDFAHRFFEHIENNVSQSCVKMEAHTARLLVEKFAHVVRAKESNLLGVTTALKANLEKLAQQKCSREMEQFSGRYRQLRTHTLKAPLFEINFTTVRPEILDLARFASSFEAYPILVQEIVRTEDVIRIAEKIVENRVRYMSLGRLLSILESCDDIGPETRVRFELCLRIVACVACFDALTTLQLFVDNSEDRDRVAELCAKVILDPVEVP
jgi:hypothetical protein